MTMDVYRIGDDGPEFKRREEDEEVTFPLEISGKRIYFTARSGVEGDGFRITSPKNATQLIGKDSFKDGDVLLGVDGYQYFAT
ncbi:hypothetical protein HY032_02215 [Candidatus Gottesmanbacteria bacterium]|nr:hypothetical protein [Candidatus Gottesmanbacteria bacterium]